MPGPFRIWGRRLICRDGGADHWGLGSLGLAPSSNHGDQGLGRERGWASIGPPSLHPGPLGPITPLTPSPCRTSVSACQVWNLPLVASCPHAPRGRGLGEQSWPWNPLWLNIGSDYWERSGSIKVGRRGLNWSENSLSLCLSISLCSLSFSAMFSTLSCNCSNWLLSSLFWNFLFLLSKFWIDLWTYYTMEFMIFISLPCGNQVLSSVGRIDM